MKLTKHRFLQYQNHVNNAHTTRKMQNILYTFLNYYRHLGQTPSLVESGQDYVRIIKMFKTVITKCHLQKPISKLPKKDLYTACHMSANAMAVWYYSNQGLLRIQVIDVEHIRKVKVAMKKVTDLFNRIKKRHDLCLGMKIGTKKVTVLYVPHNKIVLSRQMKRKLKKNKQRKHK